MHFNAHRKIADRPPLEKLMKADLRLVVSSQNLEQQSKKFEKSEILAC
jgi:hypothetical protein